MDYDAAAESERNPASKHQVHFSLSIENKQNDVGRTAEHASRDQILRRERGQGIEHFFSVQLATSQLATLPG